MFCDSDKNIIASLQHEACEGHCIDCGECLSDPDHDGFCTDCVDDHDLTRCDCPGCDETRMEMKADGRGFL